MASAQQSSSVPQNASSLLLSEALGFSPQLLLDDIINIANNAVQDGVNGMEEFLEKWADERITNGDDSPMDLEATTHEVEQGLVAFQTLLEYHTDIAFDFFEAWCLRNIFMIPNDLPIVLPHQKGLDLTVTPEQEQESMDEVEELRKRLDGQRKLNRLLTRAIRTSTRQLSQAETRLSHLSHLSPSGDGAQSPLETLQTLPSNFLHMYRTLSALPPASSLPIPTTESTTETGKRLWETSGTGYMNWALGSLLSRDDRGGGGGVREGEGHGAVDKLDAMASVVGSGESLRHALSAVQNVNKDLRPLEQSESTRAQRNHEGGLEDIMEEDSRMEE